MEFRHRVPRSIEKGFRMKLGKRLSIIGLLMPAVFLANTLEANLKVHWACTVEDSQASYKHTIASSIVPVYHTGPFTCLQGAPSAFRNSQGDIQEEVRIVCATRSGDKVSLITSCYTSKSNNGFAAMRLQSGNDWFNITLTCRR